jgi:hypothetical protein
MGVGGCHAPVVLPLGKRRGTHCIGRCGGGDPGPVWTGAENLAPTGTRASDRSTRSKSLYRLSYPGPHGSGSIVGIWVSLSLVINSSQVQVIPCNTAAASPPAPSSFCSLANSYLHRDHLTRPAGRSSRSCGVLQPSRKL